jgi:hypothetical protein
MTIMFANILIFVCLFFVFLFPLYVGLVMMIGYLSKSKQRLSVFSEKLDLVLDVLDIKYSNQDSIKKVKEEANLLTVAGKVEEADHLLADELEHESMFKQTWQQMSESARMREEQLDLSKLREKHADYLENVTGEGKRKS